MASRSPSRGAFRGLEKHREISASQLFRDTRPWYTQVYDFIEIWENQAIINFIVALVCFVLPGLSWIGMFTIPFFYFWRYYHPEHLPIRLPAESNQIDFNDPAPGRRSFRKARGIFYIGNDMRTGEELWASREDILTHMLLFGTTGAGKTYSLTGLTMNYLLMGGGLAYIDAKAVITLTADLTMGACHLGREDDILILNFITGSATIKEKSRNTMSNTSNFMRYGAAAGLSDLMVSLLSGDDSGGGGNSVFRDRAIGLMKALMLPLVDLRDAGLIALGPNTLRQFINLGSIMSISKRCYDTQSAIAQAQKKDTGVAAGRRNDNNKIDLSQFKPEFIEAIRPASMEALDAYLKDLAGFSFEKPANAQSDTANEQFGYAQMYWSRALGMLSDTYRYIYWTSVGDLDTQDVIRNCRLMIGLLPPMEKSKDELQTLGKLVLSSLKSAAAVEFPSRPTGLRKEVERPMPVAGFGLLLDEYAYINTPGFAVMPAQARGLGIGLIYAGQDYAGFKNADENEAEQVLSNTCIKFAMKLEDAQTTFTLFKELAGEGVTREVSGMEMPVGRMFSSYYDNRNVSFESKSRLNFLDLKSQIEGEAFIFQSDRMIPAFLFSHMFKKNKNQELRIQKTLPLLVIDRVTEKFNPTDVLKRMIEWRKNWKNNTGTPEERLRITIDGELESTARNIFNTSIDANHQLPWLAKDTSWDLMLVSMAKNNEQSKKQLSEMGLQNEVNTPLMGLDDDAIPQDFDENEIPMDESDFQQELRDIPSRSPTKSTASTYQPFSEDYHPSRTYMDNEDEFSDIDFDQDDILSSIHQQHKVPKRDRESADDMLMNAQKPRKPKESIQQPKSRTENMDIEHQKSHRAILDSLFLTDEDRNEIFDQNSDKY